MKKKRAVIYLIIYVFTFFIALAILLLTLSSKSWDKRICETKMVELFNYKSCLISSGEKICPKVIRLDLCPKYYILEEGETLTQDCWINFYSEENEKYIIDISFDDKTLETDRYQIFYITSIVLFSLLGITGVGSIVRYLLLFKGVIK